MNDPISQHPTLLIRGHSKEGGRIWQAGEVLDETYRIVRALGGPGISGMGIVYIVEHDGRRYAMKTFQRQFSAHLPLIQRFLREAQTWMRLGFHPNIVHAFGLDIIEAAPYLLMEYIEPGSDGRVSLAEYIRDHALDMRTALCFAIQCCEGMLHAQRLVPGLVHRDLKPENLMITREGVLKITDFGLVRCHLAQHIEEGIEPNRIDAEGLVTQVGTTLGTPAYMAPEQFVEAGTVTDMADQYAFGCCFYEALSGNRLFTVRADTPIEHLDDVRNLHLHRQPAPLRDRVSDCPEALDSVIMRCLEKDPARRWSGFVELREQLVAIYNDLFGETWQCCPPCEPAVEDAAAQDRSQRLLEGYSRAIHMQHLRRHYDHRPYAFHLALASYFRCHNEPDEERRQLEKAVRVRGNERGDEAIGRLVERQVEAGELVEAATLLDTFLTQNPDGEHLVLDAYVKLLIARSEYAQAESVLDAQDPGLRSTILRMRILHASGRYHALADILRQQINVSLKGACDDIRQIQPEDRIGWGYPGDPERMGSYLLRVAPDVDRARLDKAIHCYWPDLTAYPDFAVHMAWLSEAYGVLAQLSEGVDDDERMMAQDCATLLGYPERLRDFLLRDETWLWLNGDPEPPNPL